MTPVAQRIAIAEACGWQNVGDNPWGEYCSPMGIKDEQLSTIPDYLNDLNACHEAEKMITDWRRYSDRLMRIVQADDIALYNDSVGARYRTAGATAAQKAEAFLRTIGKWSE